MTTPPESDVCDTCGGAAAQDHSSCRKWEEECRVARAHEIEQLITDFTLRRISPANRAGYLGAVERVASTLAYPITHDEQNAFEADRWWYVPHIWIGCSGYIVEKNSAAVNQLGSAFPLSLCFWAQERGALKAPCVLTIERVHNVPLARKLIAKLDNKSPINPVPILGRRGDGRSRWLNPDEVLENLPFSLNTGGLWFALPALHEAETAHVFDFTIGPASFE